MEKFKQSIKRRIALLSIMVLVFMALGIQGYLMSGSTESASMSDGIVSGFQFGLIFGIGIRALIEIVTLSRALKDEKKIKILYNKENDERMKTIRSKAGMPMVLITSIMMVIAAIIAGYFNVVIFYTLVIAAMLQLTIGVFVKLYMMKTM
ncbi:MAG: hypothetical protein IBX70_08875 [Clostridia bacterium]|nr:hypothetical protein [Clostridia bacterium]